MLATTMTCPGCKSPVKAAAATVAGQTITCPACGVTFAAPAMGLPPLPRQRAPLPAASGRSAADLTSMKSGADHFHHTGHHEEEQSSGSKKGLFLILAGIGAITIAGFVAIPLLITPKGKHKSEKAEPIAELASAKSAADRPDLRTPEQPAEKKSVPTPGDRTPTPDRSSRPETPAPTPIGPKPLPVEPRERTPPPAPRFEQPFRPEEFLTGSGNQANSALVSLPPEEQQRVDAAIEKGVDYLLNQRFPLPGRHVVGYAALPGLTLLECDHPSLSPQKRENLQKKVQEAAAIVRQHAPSLRGTYELSLAILFLDRLGDPKDRDLIRTLALRLVAGQGPTGGWNYNCPILTPQDEQLLVTTLRQLTPSANELLATTQLSRQQPTAPLQGPAVRPGDKPTGGNMSQSVPLSLLSERILTKSQRPAARAGGAVPPSPGNPLIHLAKLPVLQDFKDPKQQMKVAANAGGDNSNTQFAVLGLWAARRYDIPLDRSLALMVMRFQTSQNVDGSWSYHYKFNGGASPSATMTGAGLLGLAVGHGLAYDIHMQAAGDRGTPDRRFTDDKMIQAGFRALARYIREEMPAAPARPGKPGKGKTAVARPGDAMRNLYFLWTVERVGVLYQLATIDGRDWYRGGANYLCELQQPGGYWQNGGYHGSKPLLDTCFALLFLKRANLARDLTDKLPSFQIDK